MKLQLRTSRLRLFCLSLSFGFVLSLALPGREEENPRFEIRVAVETSEDRRNRDETGWSRTPAAPNARPFVPRLLPLLNLPGAYLSSKCVVGSKENGLTSLLIAAFQFQLVSMRLFFTFFCLSLMQYGYRRLSLFLSRLKQRSFLSGLKIKS